MEENEVEPINPGVLKVLVNLIAKGRRARKPPEQKEIAFGLCDLSGNKDLLEKFEHYGAIKTLLGIFVKSTDTDAQRFAALALANVSQEIKTGHRFKDEGVVPVLTEYIADNDNDIVARQYCAMCLGNLAVDPGIHDHIVDNEGIESLIVLLQTQDPDGGKYSAFGLSNLATEKVNRDRMVQKGALNGLIFLAGCENVAVSRQALTALRAICLSPEYLPVIVDEGVIDPLILLSRHVDNLPVLQDIAIFYNVLSTANENKVELSKRSLIAIVSLMLTADLLIEQQSICAVANIMEMIPLHHKLVEEKGIVPVVALCSSSDLMSRGDACRCIANLALNPEMHVLLIKEGAVPHLLESLEFNDRNCQRYGALALANLAAVIKSQLSLIENYTMRAVISLAADEEAFIEGRRYALLCLANFSSTPGNHVHIMEEGGLTQVVKLHDLEDVMSAYYMSCFFSNLSASMSTHTAIVEDGGVEALISLSEVDDIDVYSQCIVALRNLAIQEEFKEKIITHDGLKILLFGVSIPNLELELLREILTCLNNLSFVPKSKMEIISLGFVDKLLEYLFSSDDVVLCQTCSVLANVVEQTSCQDAVGRPEIIKQCIVLMRSKSLAVQCESGRVIANLCSSKNEYVTHILECGGHNLLVSYLLQTNSLMHQKVAGIGLYNLAKQTKYHMVLMKCGVLEPYCYALKNDETNSIVKRHVLLAISCLATSFDTHIYFIEEGLIAVLLSLASHTDPLVHAKVAWAIVKIAHNFDMRQILTDEGALFPVLYLTKCQDEKIVKDVVQALCQLSFVSSNQPIICRHNEALAMLIQSIKMMSDSETIRLGCCTLANLMECKENLSVLLETETLDLLIAPAVQGSQWKPLFSHSSDRVRREVARILGNVSVMYDYADAIATDYVWTQLRNMLTEPVSADQQTFHKRITAFAICNISTCSKTHDRLMKSRIVQDVLAKEIKLSLEPKLPCDLETIRYYLLALSNICSSVNLHEELKTLFLETANKFSSHRDVKCREHAIFAIANLCANPANLKDIIKSKSLQTMITFAFPSHNNASHIQFQALSGLRGLSAQNSYRSTLIRDGILEPLIISGSSPSVEIRRVAAVSLENLSLTSECVLPMVTGGTLAILKQLASTDDTQTVLYAVTAIANMTEITDEKVIVHDKMIECGVLDLLEKLATSDWSDEGDEANIKIQIMRAFALFTARKNTHKAIVMHYLSLQAIAKITLESKLHDIHKYGVQAIANISLTWDTHKHLVDNKAILVIQRCIDFTMDYHVAEDVQCLKSAAFACNQLCSNELNHAECVRHNLGKELCLLLEIEDKDVYLQAVLAIRKYAASLESCEQLVVHGVVEKLFNLLKQDDVEVKRECAAALRNIGLHEIGKIAIFNMEGCIAELSNMMHSFDTNICFQSTITIANISESIEKLPKMTQSGIIQHLKFVGRSKNKDIQREAARAVANICCDQVNALVLISEGILSSIMSALHSADYVNQRYAVLSLMNLTSTESIQSAVISEGALPSLVSLVQFSNGDVESQRFSAAALANLAVAVPNHAIMADKFNLIAIFARLLLENTDLNVRESAILAIANYSTNQAYHQHILDTNILTLIVSFLHASYSEQENDAFLQLKAISVLRGLSTNAEARRIVIEQGTVLPLLQLFQSPIQETREEALMCLCNLSLSGIIADNADMVLRTVPLSELLVFLYSNEAAKRLFGALALGNISMSTALCTHVIASESVDALVILSKYADQETLRCIGYTLCNFIAMNQDKQFYMISKGSMYSICLLAVSADETDRLTAFIALRVLSVSTAENRSKMLINIDFFNIFSLSHFKMECLEIFNEATQLLHCLSLNHDNKLKIAKSNHAIIFLLQAINGYYHQPEYEAGVVYAASCLANVSENVDTWTCFDSEEGVCQLVEIFCDIRSANIRKEVCRLLSNLCCDERCQRHIVDMNGVVALLTHGCCNQEQDDVLQLSALTAILNISAHTDKHHKLLDFNTCETLMSLFDSDPRSGSDSGALQSSVVESDHYSTVLKILSNLSAHPSFSQHVTNETALQFLRQSIAYENVNTFDGANLLCKILAFNIDSETSILDTKIVVSLIDLLSLHVYDNLTAVILCSLKHSAYHSVNCVAMTSTNQLLQLWIDIMRIFQTNFEAMQLSEFASVSSSATYKFDYYNGKDILYEMASCASLIASQAETRMKLLSTEFLVPLLHLCQYEQSDVSSHVLCTLAALSEQTSVTSSVMNAIDAFVTVLPLMRDSSRPVQREACRTVANMLTSPYYHKLFFENVGVDLLSRAARASNQENEILFNCSSIARKLTAVRDNHITLWESRQFFPATLHLTSSHMEVRTRKLALMALRDISSNPLFKLLFVDDDGLERIVDILYEHEIALSMVCMDILRHLALHKKITPMLSSSSRIMRVIFKIVDRIDHIPLLRRVCAVCVNLSEHDETHIDMLKEGLLPRLCLMVNQYQDHNMLTNIAKVYDFLSSNTSEMLTFFQAVDIETMIKLTRISAAKQCVKFSYAALGNIALHIPYHQIIVRMNAVSGIHADMKLMQSFFTQQPTASAISDGEWSQALELGVRYLAHVARVEGEAQTQLRDSGILNTIISFLSDERLASERSVRKFILMTLANLGAYTSNHHSIAEGGFISLLLANIRLFEDHEMLQYATSAIANLARNAELQYLIVKLNGAEALLQSLRTRLPEWNTTFMAFANLASNYHFRVHLMSSGCLNIKDLCFASNISVSYLQAISLMLFNLSCHFDSYLYFLNDEVISSLLFMMNRKDDLKCRENAIKAICNISSYCFNDAFDLRSKILKAVIEFLRTTTSIVDQRYALIALLNMSTTVPDHVINHGAVSAVMDLQATDKAAKLYTTLLMANLLRTDANRLMLLNKNVYNYLESQTSSDKAYVREFGNLAIANLANTNDQSLTKYVCQRRGVPHIVNLTKEHQSVNSVYLAIASINKIMVFEANRPFINDTGIFDYISNLGYLPYLELKQQVSFCLSLLSAQSEIDSSSHYKEEIAFKCGNILSHLLIQHDLEDILYHTCITVNNLTKDLNTHRYIIASKISERLQYLLLYSLQTKREAITAIANLLSSSIFRDYIIQHGLEQLSDDSTLIDDIPFCHQLALCVSKLSFEPSFHANFVRTNGVKLLYHLIQLDHVLTQVTAAKVMRYLATFPEYHLIIGANDGIAKLMEVSQTKDYILNTTMFSILRLLATNPTLKSQILLPTKKAPSKKPGLKEKRAQNAKNGKNEVDSGTQNCIQHAVSSLTKNHVVVTEDLQVETTGLFANLSEYPENCKLMAKLNLASVLYDLVQVDNYEILLNVTRTYANFATTPETHETLLAQGIMRSILVPLQSDNDDIQKYASVCLQYLAGDEHTRALLASAEGLEPYLLMGSSSIAYFKSSAAESFSSMSCHSDNLPQMVQLGFIPVCIGLAYDFDIDIVNNALFALCNCAECVDYHLLLVEFGILSLISETFENPKLFDSEVTQLNVTRLISTLAQTDFVKGEALTKNLVPALISVAKSKNAVIQRYATIGLSNLTCWDTSIPKQHLMDAGILRTLVFLMRYPDVEVQKFSTLATTGLLLGAENDLKLSTCDERFANALISLMKFPEKHMTILALMAFNALCLTPDLVGTDSEVLRVIDQGSDGLATILHTLRNIYHENAIVAGVTAAIATSDDTAQVTVPGGEAVTEPEGHAESMTEEGRHATERLDVVIVRALSSKDDVEIVYHAISILGSLCELEDMKQTLLHLDVLSLVLDFAMIDNNKIKRAIAYFLALISMSKRHHYYLSDHQFRAINVIIAFSRNEDMCISDLSCFALAHLAANAEYQVQLAEMGVVKLLVSLIAADQQAKHYASVALMSLSNNYENHLTIAEEGGISAILNVGKRETGFYDHVQWDASYMSGTLAQQALKNLKPSHLLDLPELSAAPNNNKTMRKKSTKL